MQQKKIKNKTQLQKNSWPACPSQNLSLTDLYEFKAPQLKFNILSNAAFSVGFCVICLPFHAHHKSWRAIPTLAGAKRCHFNLNFVVARSVRPDPFHCGDVTAIKRAEKQ